MRGPPAGIVAAPAGGREIVIARGMHFAAAAAASLALFGCKSPAQLREAAIAKAEAGCAARGKQFVLHDVHISESMNVGTATVNGACIGPGEPGWRDGPAPASASSGPVGR